MACLTSETLTALAHGVIPRGELPTIRAHLPACATCLDAVARAARERRRTETGPRPEPVELTSAPSPELRTPTVPRDAERRTGPSGWARWSAVLVACVALGACLSWGAPELRIVPRLEASMTHALDLARSGVAIVGRQPAWTSLVSQVQTQLQRLAARWNDSGTGETGENAEPQDASARTARAGAN